MRCRPGEFFLQEFDVLLGLVQAGDQASASVGGVADRLDGGAGEGDGVEDAGLDRIGPPGRQAEIGGVGGGMVSRWVGANLNPRADVTLR